MTVTQVTLAHWLWKCPPSVETPAQSRNFPWCHHFLPPCYKILSLKTCPQTKPPSQVIMRGCGKNALYNSACLGQKIPSVLHTIALSLTYPLNHPLFPSTMTAHYAPSTQLQGCPTGLLADSSLSTAQEHLLSGPW